MFSCYGWALLRSSREPYVGVRIEDIDTIDDRVDSADERIWADFKSWMKRHFGCDERNSFWLLRPKESNKTWHFYEQYNHERGLLLFMDSCNHRASYFFDMLEWIKTNGPASYGLFYVHDDEDYLRAKLADVEYADHSNSFRAFRLARGEVTELADPFLSPIVPVLGPDSNTR